MTHPAPTPPPASRAARQGVDVHIYQKVQGKIVKNSIHRRGNNTKAVHLLFDGNNHYDLLCPRLKSRGCTFAVPADPGPEACASLHYPRPPPTLVSPSTWP